MDDDPFGSSVWAAEPSAFSSSEASSSRLDTAFPPTSVNDGFDDFDDFGETAVSAELATDDDFGDFGDFGDSAVESSAFDDGFGDDATTMPTSITEMKMLQLDPLPSQRELRAQIEQLLEPIFPQSKMAQLMTDEPIREIQGVNQLLVTEESRRLYKMLMEPPSQMSPPTWTRSRTRRQHLISLGIPVNLDEMLPRPAPNALPQLKITTRPMSAPPGPRDAAQAPGLTAIAASATASRGGTPPRAGTPRTGTPIAGTPVRERGEVAQLRLGPKPELDEGKANELLELNTDALTLVPLSKIEANLAAIKEQTVKASALLTYLLQTRDALQQDSEMYNKLIGDLVSQATQRAGPVGKARNPTRKGSGFV